MIKKVGVILVLTVMLAGITSLAVNAENIEGTEVISQSIYSTELIETPEAGSNLEQLFQFKITIDGKEVSFPTDCKEIEDWGWTLDKNYSDFSSLQYIKGNISIYVGMDYDPDVPLEKLPVRSIGISSSGIPDSEVVLPGNIILGKSTTADAIEAYGTQSLEYMFIDYRNKLDPYGIRYDIYNPLYIGKYISFSWYGRNFPEGLSDNTIASIFITK